MYIHTLHTIILSYSSILCLWQGGVAPCLVQAPGSPLDRRHGAILGKGARCLIESSAVALSVAWLDQENDGCVCWCLTTLHYIYSVYHVIYQCYLMVAVDHVWLHCYGVSNEIQGFFGVMDFSCPLQRRSRSHAKWRSTCQHASHWKKDRFTGGGDAASNDP